MNNIKCEFMIQRTDFNNNKPFCGLLDQNCSEIKFICDKNCRVFEIQQQNKQMRELLKKHCKRCDSCRIGYCNRDNCYIYQALKGG